MIPLRRVGGSDGKNGKARKKTESLSDRKKAGLRRMKQGDDDDYTRKNPE